MLAGNVVKLAHAQNLEESIHLDGVPARALLVSRRVPEVTVRGLGLLPRWALA